MGLSPPALKVVGNVINPRGIVLLGVVMRKIVISALLAFLIISLSASPANAYQIDSKVTVEINPNAELLSVVYYLAFGNDPFVIDRGQYLEDVEHYFGKYRNMEAVKMLQEHIPESLETPKRDYRLLVVEWYLLQCTDPPNITPEIIIDDEWMQDFLVALRDFAKKTDFMKFYEEHQGYYQEDLSIYVNALKQLPPDKFMGRYTNVDNVTFEFLHPYLVAIHGHSFNPVLHGHQIWGAGGMLPLVRRTPQRTHWSYITARDTIFGLPLNKDYIYNRELDSLLYLGFIYHELGHDITTSQLNAHTGAVYSISYFQSVIQQNMPYLAKYDIHFWNQGTLIYESFADGWLDFAVSHVNKNFTELAMWMQRGWGEFWIDDMVHLYEKYTTLSTETGNSISDYVPQMLSDLQNEYTLDKAREEFQKRVPITPLMAFDRGAVTGKVIVVYGTQNPNTSGVIYDMHTAEKIAQILKGFYSQWGSPVNVTVKADIELNQSDLKDNLVIVGGPVANEIAKEMQADFPLEFVEKNGQWVIEHNQNWNVSSFILTENTEKPVLIGKLKDVSNGALILAIRNPNNPKNFIVWVAGTDRYGTRLYTNPTYYLNSYEIYAGKEIEMGFYVQPLS